MCVTGILGTRPTVQQTASAVTQNFLIQDRLQNGNTVGQLRDLLVIIDSSGSIGSTDFNDAKSQLARLLGYLCPTPDPFDSYQQAALIRFASSVTEMFDFNDKSNTQEVKDGVESTNYTGGQTCTATAFNYAKNYMFSTTKGMYMYH